MIEKLKVKFPTQSYVVCTQNNQTSQKGEIGKLQVFRTIPTMSSHLIFMNFNDIANHKLDFTTSLLFTVNIQKRAHALLKLASLGKDADTQLLFSL